MFHELLKTFRLQAGMSQVQLAKAVEMNPSHLNRVERSLRKPPKREKVLLLADALGLDDGEKTAFLLEAGYAPPEQKGEKSHAARRGYTAILPQKGLEQLEVDEESKTLPELVREVLKDQTITPSRRREMAKQIRSFVLWLHTTMKKPSRRKSSLKDRNR